MKYAGKPQKLNPNKPSHLKDWDVWEVIQYNSNNDSALEAQGWYLSPIDNFKDWFTLKSLCPQSVTPRQIRQALILYGVYEEQIDAAFNSLTSPTKDLALAEWKFSKEIFRDRPLVKQTAKMLGWSEFQLDSLWVFASNIP